MQQQTNELSRRVTELEGEVAGEKRITRHILDQLRQNTELLIALRKDIRDQMSGIMVAMNDRFNGVDGRLDAIEYRVEQQGNAIALMHAHMTSFEAKFAGIAADAVREAIKPRREE